MDYIIKSLCDNDNYKFSMLWFIVFHGLDKHEVGWEFFPRGEVKYPIGFAATLQEEVNNWKNLTFQQDELDFIWSKCKNWLNYNFVYSYLKSYKINSDLIEIKSWVSTIPNTNETYESISVKYGGKWGENIFFEVMLLACINEIYNKMTFDEKDTLSFSEIVVRNSQKFQKMKELDISFYEFGTRRRNSLDIQELAIKSAIDYGVIKGTSNLYFAKKYDLPIFGTMAHELFSVIGAIYGCESANQVVMGKWVECFHGNLGIALTDTFTTNHFLTHSFDHFYSQLFNGVREDSSNTPKQYVDEIIDHYKSLGIDPTTKTIVHSNSLSSIEKMYELQEYRKGEIRRQMGVGTFISADVAREGSGKKLNGWVIKTTYVVVNGQKRYTVKLGDDPVKVTSISPKTVDCYKFLLGIEA